MPKDREMLWQPDIFIVMCNIGMQKDRETPWQPDSFMLMHNIGMPKDRGMPKLLEGYVKMMGNTEPMKQRDARQIDDGISTMNIHT
jgi:hypothetical protein